MSAEGDWTRRDFLADDTTSHVLQLRSTLLVGIQQDLILLKPSYSHFRAMVVDIVQVTKGWMDYEEVINE